MGFCRRVRDRRRGSCSVPRGWEAVTSGPSPDAKRILLAIVIVADVGLFLAVLLGVTVGKEKPKA